MKRKRIIRGRTMVRRLLYQKLGMDYIRPAYLYYRSRANWAEIQVWEYEDSIEWEGEINARPKSGSFGASLGDTIEHLQYYWQRQELPPRYDSPTQVKFSCACTNKQGEARADCGTWGPDDEPEPQDHRPAVGPLQAYN